MSDYTIYALKRSGNADRDAATYRSLKEEGVGRFGWSYVETADLKKLQARIRNGEWNHFTDAEKDCYRAFLLDIKAGDYVVYINIPKWGRCTLARVTDGYFWGYGDDKDFRHCFPVALESVRDFNRNDAIVHPVLSSRLKLQGRFWRIYNLQEEFESLVNSLEKGEDGQPRTMETSLNRFKKEIQRDFESITKKIHRVYPGSDLEKPIADIFRNVPGVKEVKEQGGPGECGADLRVIFEWGVPGFQEQCTCVVQVKSFEGKMWETKAVDQIREALERWDADMGIIVSTASSGSEALDAKIEKLSEQTKKPVYLLIGEDVAAFMLRFGGELLF